MMIDLEGIKIGYAMTGSFCTFKKSFEQAQQLVNMGAELIPIMSFNASTMNTRFGTAQENIEIIETITNRKIINTIEDAEPIGPKRMTDIMIVAPCTGNTMAKLANSITDTSVTMAVKSHLRNSKPVVICMASNDSLSGSAKNIGTLMNLKNYYFVPLAQDDCEHKPTSIVSDFSRIPCTLQLALSGIQLQPMLL